MDQAFSHYRILSKIGGGGMGVVYEAEDTDLGRHVAIKLLPEELAHNYEAMERFVREARAASALNHPHICTIHELGKQDDQPFIVMELMEGRTLKEEIGGHALPIERVIRLGAQITDGLEAAHGAGIVHRDIKPANIFVTERGEAKLLDFGLAKLAAGRVRAAVADATQDATLSQPDLVTTPGTTMGTVSYMSPEQALGKEVDARSDLFSLGVVLYEMATGTLPFRGDSPAETINAVLNKEPVPPVRLNPDVPADLERIIAKALEKDPALRCQSATEVEADLKRLARDTGPVETAPSMVAVPRRRPSWAMAAGIAAAAVAFAVAGALLLRSRQAPPSATTGPKRIAVLPFENLGAKDDDYFADGMTDEVRNKLTSLAGLAVIARSSSNDYKGTTKSANRIAEELGTPYLLTATVRWEKGAGGASRIRVTPELVEVTGAGAPVARWRDSFDATLTDVFQVQGEIAIRVAQALDVALSAGSKQRLAEKPTQSLAAYEAYLRGEEASQAMTAIDPPSLRRAVDYYEQAVALDAGFMEAWARLSLSSSFLYYNGTPTPSLEARAREAAERALALAPERPEGHLALGSYYSNVLKDYARALPELQRARALAPGDSGCASSAAVAEQSLGRWEAALGHLEEARRLDPRSVVTLQRLAVTALWLRRTADARQTFDAVLTLAPNNLALLEEKAMTYLQEGELAGARSALKAVPREIEPTALVAYVAYYWDLVWVLDQGQRDLLLRLTPSAFDDDRGAWAICLTQAYALMRDEANVRKYADIARAAFVEQLEAVPDDPQRHALVGLSFAYLGRKSEAIRQAERAVELLPISMDAYGGAYIQHQLVRVYILVGEHEKALDSLEPLLKVPYYLTPGWLAIDPNFALLKGNPRFEKLLKSKG